MNLHHYKFRKGTLVTQFSFITAGLISMSAEAIVPADLDGWSADLAGNITTTCPTGFRCTVDIHEGGFLQEILSEINLDGSLKRNGDTYYRSIISEKDFSSSSLVKHNRNQSSALQRHGIASKQTLGTSQTTLNAQTNFSSATAIYTGWASGLSSSDLQTSQAINEVFRKAGAGGVYLEGNFVSSTNINANYDENGTRTGFSFAANQSLDEPGEYIGGAYNEIDSQVFAMRGLEGDMLTAAGSLTLNGQSLSWAAGEKLWGHVIGQNFHHTSLTGGGERLLFRDPSRGSENLGVMVESYDNRSDSAGAVNYFAYFENNTTGWPTVFGSAPVLPAATGSNGNLPVDGPGPAPTLVAGLFTPTAVGPEQVDGRDAPLAFGQWNVVGGTLTAEGVLADPIDLVGDGFSPVTPFSQGGDGSVMPECSPDVTCDTAVIAGPGMVQRVVTDLDGKRYVQTILTDLDTGFSSESFVSIADPATPTYRHNGGTSGPKESGISLSMVMSKDRADIDFNGHISTNVDINTGWAARTGKPNIEIIQDANETGLYGSQFLQHFAYQGNLDADGNNIGSLVDIDQSGVRLGSLYGGFGIGTIDTIGFAQRSRSGNLQNDIGGVGPISWAAGDAITATWVKGSFSSGQTDRFGGVFYDNLVDDVSYEDVGWRFGGYQGLGSDWVNSAFGATPQ